VEHSENQTRLYEQIETDLFIKQLKDICNDAEGARLKDHVCRTREFGDKVLKYGIRKIRVPLKGRGKRGGGGVVYFYQNEKSNFVLFLTIFSKNEQENLNRHQEQLIIHDVESFRKSRR
jgi:hypothetical protein